MPQNLLPLTLPHLHVVVTPWKVIGWTGTLLFTARWFVQAVHRHRTGSSQVPTLFWWLSLTGAALSLSYFIFGKNDSVGIMQTAFPVSVACYNLWQDARSRSHPAPERPA